MVANFHSEVQPIVHRTISQPVIERVEQHITERVVQPTTMTKEVINDVPLAQQQQQFVAAGGPVLPMQQQGMKQCCVGTFSSSEGCSSIVTDLQRLVL